MVAPRRRKRIFCTVIAVPVADDSIMNFNDQRFSSRPSELVPWSDPYIAKLVSKLQAEVRDERGGVATTLCSRSSTFAELEPPSPATDSDWDWYDDLRWSRYDES